MPRPNEVAHEYNLTLLENNSADYDAVIVAVNHNEYKSHRPEFLNPL